MIVGDLGEEAIQSVADVHLMLDQGSSAAAALTAFRLDAALFTDGRGCRTVPGVACATFIRDVASGTIAGLVAGALLLWVGYRLIDRRVHLRDALDRRAEREEQDKHNRRIALQAVYVELESNASLLVTTMSALERRQVPFPLFDVTTLTLAFEPAIFTTLQTETVEALLHVHNRMVAANAQHALVFDLSYGSTAIQTVMASAGTTNPGIQSAYDSFQAHRDTIRDGLLDRCQHLKPYLDTAIDAVEAELGIDAAEPAAERNYETTSPIGYIGGNQREDP